jgi:hypothetical protein
MKTLPSISIYKGGGLQHSARLTNKILICEIEIANQIPKEPGNYSMIVDFENKHGIMRRRSFSFYIPEGE